MPRSITPTTAPRRLLETTQSLLDRYGASDEAFQAIGAELRRLARHPELGALIAAHEPYAGLARTLVLAEDARGQTLLLTWAPNGRSTPEPLGSGWGVACVVRGRNRLTTWRPGSSGAPQRAGEIDLNPGDFVYFHDAPSALHSRQGIGGPSWELLLLGGALPTGVAHAA